MSATRQDIDRWFEAGLLSEATHMIVVCDTYDYENYPVYVNKGENVEEKAKEFEGKNMQSIDEVYNLSMDKNKQLNERRSSHYKGGKMNVYKAKFHRLNFDFNPALEQISDVILMTDIPFDNDNIEAFEDALWNEVWKQNPHWKDPKGPIKGMSGWSSVMHVPETKYEKIGELKWILSAT
jgi:hypothetical protein